MTGAVYIERCKYGSEGGLCRPTAEMRQGGTFLPAFREPRKDGSSNAMVANILEHGSSKQPARPFLRPARTATRKPAIEAMTAHLEKELQNV